jgi:hypothetical protein
MKEEHTSERSGAVGGDLPRGALRGMRCAYHSKESVRAIGIRTNAPRFVAVTGDRLIAWDPNTSLPMGRTWAFGDAGSIRITADTTTHSHISLDGRVLAWTTEEQRCARLHVAELADDMLETTPDGLLLLRRPFSHRLPALVNRYGLAPLAVSPGGTCVAVATEDARVRVFRVSSADVVLDVEMPVVDAHPNALRHASEVFVDDTTLITLRHKQIQVWSLANGGVIASDEAPNLFYRGPYDDDYTELAYGPDWLRRHAPGAGLTGVGATTADGRHGIRAGSEQPMVEIVETETAAVLHAMRVLCNYPPRVIDVALSADGQLAAVRERSVWSAWLLDWELLGGGPR